MLREENQNNRDEYHSYEIKRYKDSYNSAEQIIRPDY